MLNILVSGQLKASQIEVIITKNSIPQLRVVEKACKHVSRFFQYYFKLRIDNKWSSMISPKQKHHDGCEYTSSILKC